MCKLRVCPPGHCDVYLLSRCYQARQPGAGSSVHHYHHRHPSSSTVFLLKQGRVEIGFDAQRLPTRTATTGWGVIDVVRASLFDVAPAQTLTWPVPRAQSPPQRHLADAFGAVSQFPRIVEPRVQTGSGRPPDVGRRRNPCFLARAAFFFPSSPLLPETVVTAVLRKGRVGENTPPDGAAKLRSGSETCLAAPLSGWPAASGHSAAFPGVCSASDGLQGWSECLSGVALRRRSPHFKLAPGPGAGVGMSRSTKKNYWPTRAGTSWCPPLASDGS